MLKIGFKRRILAYRGVKIPHIAALGRNNDTHSGGSDGADSPMAACGRDCAACVKILTILRRAMVAISVSIVYNRSDKGMALFAARGPAVLDRLGNHYSECRRSFP